ncbi:ABC transporter substrate-binding protein [Rhodococcoides yunnanense]|uniref:ABC transporter substrate-binding protein n=1 Tax=Rhodococcoides yunnanense TaxID=278209 RepID=UPI0014764277|nr:ABC transporter substrate-binding protein [Rhodococcus yunnanensis]
MGSTIAVVAALCALAGCSANAESGSGTETLTIAMPADPTCLDPQQTGQLAATDVSRSLVDSLTEQDPETGEIVPWLAESFEIEDDAKTFDFTLRSGVTFSDGTPVDAAAVKATFDKLVTLPATGAPAYVRGYTGTTVVDPLHFSIGFNAPNAQFLQATSLTGLGILSPATAEIPLADRCRGAFVGSGPFVLDRYTPNQDVVIKRRADYAWPASSSSNPGAAVLDEVHYLFVPEEGARTSALASGQVQVAENIQSTDRQQFDGNGFSLLSNRLPGAVAPLSLNHVGILADQRVREALLVGIDRRELVDAIIGPQAAPATSVLASSTPFYVETDKLTFDPDNAKQLLTDAGWVPGPDGIRVSDGRRLSLKWLIPAPASPEKQYIQQQFAKIGIDIVLDIVPPPTYVEQQNAGNFDLTAVGVTRADPDVLRNLFSSTGQNLWHLPPSELDRYLDGQAAATDDAARQEAVTNAVDWLLDHADTVPLYENAQVHGVSDQVADLTTDASARLNLHSAKLG